MSKNPYNNPMNPMGGPGSMGGGPGGPGSMGGGPGGMGMGGMNSGMGGPGGIGSMSGGPGGAMGGGSRGGGGMGSMGSMNSSMGMGGFSSDTSVSGTTSSMGSMLGGGMGPTGGMVSTPRVMGPGSTTSMGRGGGMGSMVGSNTGGMRMMGMGGPNVSMVPGTTNSMVGQSGLGGGMGSMGGMSGSSMTSSSMIRPGSVQGSVGMRMPVSTSTPPVGAMPISQHQQSSLGTPSMMTSSTLSSTPTLGSANSSSTPQTSTTQSSTTNSTAQSDTSGGNTENAASGDAAAQQPKAPNTIYICRIGQETVEEIGSRTIEIFSKLKTLQPPVGQYNQQSIMNDRSIQDRQSNVKELLRVIRMLLKRLRVCWERCEEGTASIEHPPLPNLIPIKDDSDPSRGEIEKKRGENYRSALDEHNELIQQIILKNRHLKDIIDQMRNTIWEINTMLAMRT